MSLMIRLFAIACCVSALAGCGLFTTVVPAPGSPSRTELEQLLGTVRTVDDRVRPGGYERGCKNGQACVFGPAWSDDTDAPGGHDGCDTRNNVLAQQLSGVRFRAGTGNCVVLEGTLADPYTGTTLAFRKAAGGQIEVDHVYPLAAAWDLGASAWTPAQRRRFANDTRVNLLAVRAEVNQSKGDSTPAEWLPPARAYHCFYAGKYLTAATEYSLPITAADRATLARVARRC